MSEDEVEELIEDWTLTPDTGTTAGKHASAQVATVTSLGAGKHANDNVGKDSGKPAGKPAGGASGKPAGKRADKKAAKRTPKSTAEVGKDSGADPGNAVVEAAEADAPVEELLAEAKPSNPKGARKRLLGLLRPYRSRVWAMVLIGVAGVAMYASGPLILGNATNLILGGAISANLKSGLSQAQAIAQLKASGQGTLANVLTTVTVTPGEGIDFRKVGELLVIVLALYIGVTVFSLIQERMAATVVQKVVLELRDKVSDKLCRLPLQYFDGNSRGDLLSRVTNDIDNMQNTLQRTLSKLITSAMSALGALVLMVVISPLLTGVLLVVLPIAGVIAARISKRAQPRYAEQWNATGHLNGHVDEMYTGHALLTVFGRQDKAARTFDEYNEQVNVHSKKAVALSGSIMPATQMITNMVYILVAVIGALRVASGALSLGGVQAFLQYTSYFGGQASEIGSITADLQSGVASAERVFELLDAQEMVPDSEHPQRPEVTRGRIEFENVSFRYKEDTPLIEDLSFTVEPGQTVAIVGPTGAGKSTLGNLLMRFYELNGGRILLDGVDIAEMSRADLRQQTGLVLQDTWLFDGTIAENIRYGKQNATYDEIYQAAKATRVHHLVRNLPDGYETEVGESSGISAGERQLLTITRAFLADPTILILDEATSSVDTRSEVLIQRAMQSLRDKRTSFVIAHRLSTIRNADLILVLDAGKIIERGTHEELVAKQGAYAQLHASQFVGSVLAT